MKERTKNFLILVLIIGITSMTVAYANFVTRLTINNNTRVNASNWDIHFENLVQKEKETGNTAVVITPATIQPGSLVISGLEMNLNKPRDNIVYTFDVKNAGDIDAELINYVLSEPVCEENPSYCNNIEYSLKYTNGNEIQVGDVLNAGESKNLTMKIGLKATTTDTTTVDINVTNLTAIFDYAQK